MKLNNANLRRAFWILSTTLLLTLISVIGWYTISFDSSVEVMLPEKSEARQSIQFLRESNFAAKAVLWFRLRGDGSSADLISAADNLVKQLDPKIVTRVIQPPNQANAMTELTSFLDHAGELLDENDLTELDQATAPDALRKRMRECYMQLAKPEGSFMQEFIRRDPLGINTRILTRLLGLTKAMGYKAEINHGHFLHPDGKQLILILETAAPVTSISGSNELLTHLNTLIASAPPNVEIVPICGHIHTVQNDATMQRDIQLVTVVDAIGFVLVFLLFCRDWRVAAVFFVPMIAITISVGLCGLIFPSVSIMVIGLAATMAGSAVDYGIHVYTAVRSGSDPYADAKRIRRPLITGMLTTLGVFIAFLFSAIPAYRQLGCMASLSLILSLLGAMYILPALIRPGSTMFHSRGKPLQNWGRKTIPLAYVSIALLLVTSFFAIRARFDADLTKLDGVHPDTVKLENDFQRTWGGSEESMAILVVSGPTLPDAQSNNDRIYHLLSNQLPDGHFASLSSFYPSAPTRAANLKRWNDYWSSQRQATLRQNLAIAGEPFDFAPTIFEPFFASLSAPPQTLPTGEILPALQQQFVIQTNGQYRMLSFFPDTAANIAAARKLLHDQPNTQIISRRALGQAFADTAISESRLLVGISAAFIIVSMLLLTRHIPKSIISMLPAIGGLVAMLAMLAFTSISLNVATVVAAIVAMGLSIDYGVFAVHACSHNESTLGHGMMSMHLSSLTTLIGTTSLLFAVHPAIFTVGISLTTGLLVGYLLAFLVVPAIYFRFIRSQTKTAPAHSPAEKETINV